MKEKMKALWKSLRAEESNIISPNCKHQLAINLGWQQWMSMVKGMLLCTDDTHGVIKIKMKALVLCNFRNYLPSDKVSLSFNWLINWLMVAAVTMYGWTLLGYIKTPQGSQMAGFSFSHGMWQYVIFFLVTHCPWKSCCLPVHNNAAMFYVQ